jgi:hypothetical protein
LMLAYAWGGPPEHAECRELPLSCTKRKMPELVARALRSMRCYSLLLQLAASMQAKICAHSAFLRQSALTSATQVGPAN